MNGHRHALAFATALFALPLFAYSQNSTTQSSTRAAEAPLPGHHEAALMRPGRATLVKTIDAAHDQSGQTVDAKLQGKVRLTNGTELPRGTMLLGKVTADDMQQQGKSKLALRFDEARLKDGTTVPIRATIVGFYGAGSVEESPEEVDNGPLPNQWTAKTVQLDQEDAIPGVDLHSRIASHNSGVFVATKKDDVKLREGSEIEFAIAPATKGLAAGSQS